MTYNDWKDRCERAEKALQTEQALRELDFETNANTCHSYAVSLVGFPTTIALMTKAGIELTEVDTYFLNHWDGLHEWSYETLAAKVKEENEYNLLK